MKVSTMKKELVINEISERPKGMYETRILSYLANKHNVFLDEIVRDTKMPRIDAMVTLNDLERAGKIHSDLVRGKTYRGPHKSDTYSFVRRFNLTESINGPRDQ